MYESIILFVAGLVAGLVNSVAGGGAILMYPLLIGLGLSPIIANATTTISIWPGALSSAYGYRKHIAKLPQYYYWILLPSVVGGIVGAVILRKTTNHDFGLIVPWLVVAAVILLSVQPYIHNKLKSKKAGANRTGLLTFLIILIATLGISIYGGYFGAGFGIIMLAILGFTKLTDIHQINGLKNLTAVCVNCVASIYFLWFKLIDWRYAPLLLIGAVIGGYVGSTYSYKLPTSLIRKTIIACGVVVAIVLLVRR